MDQLKYQPLDPPREVGRIRPHEHADDTEDENEEDGTKDTGQATSSQNTVLLLQLLYIIHH